MTALSPLVSHPATWFDCLQEGRGLVEDYRGIARRTQPAVGSVRVVSRLSARAVLVSWCDARCGRGREETWIARIAKRQGVCLLTGKPVHCGDKVYGPRLAPQIPALCEWLVLEGQVVGLELEEER